ncbi:CAP domain-containing protein [Streptomyces peucetius]|uniref:CAP domain-containing protein n=1 Tax=Streptomyces peucetius TaxID=1950 RepID=A0ABY6I322_STRPE|nr:CAP domain-containing protein [Streptomyces peucetius]UYQ60145.1 CAP domain-containing protein [Streptomyces peucetius]
MSKHRRTTHYRKTIIAGVAVAAVGVPSVAMACIDPQEMQEGRSHDPWKSAHSGRQWDGNDHRWEGHKRDWKPTASESQTATTTPGTRKPAAPKPAAPKPAAPKPASPKPAAPKPASPVSGDVARVVALVNSERSKAGCSPVTLNAKLTKAAQDHSKDMAAHRNMSHTGSDGSDAGERITRAGYAWSTYGENVAYGYATPESVMAGWMASPGHKRNILNCAFNEIGVGLAQPGNYWTQDFGAA